MRKDHKVLVGFVGTLVGVAGVLAIYLPNYSAAAVQARERAARSRGGDAPPAKPSSSMWKNIDKKRGGE